MQVSSCQPWTTAEEVELLRILGEWTGQRGPAARDFESIAARLGTGRSASATQQHCKSSAAATSAFYEAVVRKLAATAKGLQPLPFPIPPWASLSIAAKDLVETMQWLDLPDRPSSAGSASSNTMPIVELRQVQPGGTPGAEMAATQPVAAAMPMPIAPPPAATLVSAAPLTPSNPFAYAIEEID